MKPDLTPQYVLPRALTAVLIVGCIILAYAARQVGVAADKVTNTSLHLRDVHDSYVAATDEMNYAAGKYHGAFAELQRLNKLLEQTYGRPERQ